MKKQFLETGKITGTHGIKGMVRIQPWCDSFEFLNNFKRFYLDPQGETYLEVLRISPNGNVVIAKFKNVDSIEQAEKYRNKVIFINRDDVELADGIDFIQDIIDCDVYDVDTGANLGKITDVSATGANDVWHIANNGKEYLIPAIDDVVIKTDIDNGKVFIRPLKGIFEDED